MALVLLALCVAVALGAYLLYGMHLEMVSLREEMVSLREEVARLQEQGSSGKATLLVLQNRTLSGLQQLQSTLHRLNAGGLRCRWCGALSSSGLTHWSFFSEDCQSWGEQYHAQQHPSGAGSHRGHA